MKRRNVIAGVVGLSGAGSLTLGTGAFTQSTAARNADVSVELDTSAYLKLDTMDGRYSGEQKGQIEFEFSRETSTGGSGVNSDAVYHFDGFNGVIEIENHSMNTIDVFGEQADTDGPNVELYDAADPDKEVLTSSNPYRLLPIKESENPQQYRLGVGVKIGTSGVPSQDEPHNVQVSIVGKDPNSGEVYE